MFTVLQTSNVPNTVRYIFGMLRKFECMTLDVKNRVWNLAYGEFFLGFVPYFTKHELV